MRCSDERVSRWEAPWRSSLIYCDSVLSSRLSNQDILEASCSVTPLDALLKFFERVLVPKMFLLLLFECCSNVLDVLNWKCACSMAIICILYSYNCIHWFSRSTIDSSNYWNGHDSYRLNQIVWFGAPRWELVPKILIENSMQQHRFVNDLQ